jgi:hypothetical protein
MDLNPMPIGVIAVVLLIGIPLGLAIGAVFLRAAAKMVTKTEIPFGRATLIAFVAGIASLPVALIIGLGFGFSGGHAIVGQVLSSVINFFVSSAVYGAMITHPYSKQSVGFGKGVGISLVLILLLIAAAIMIGGIVFISATLLFT